MAARSEQSDALNVRLNRASLHSLGLLTAEILVEGRGEGQNISYL